MYKQALLSMLMIFGVGLTLSKESTRRFETVSLTLKDEFKRSCKDNLTYFVDRDLLALNYTNIEEDIIKIIEKKKVDVNYSFKYEGNVGFAYPMYVKKISFNYFVKDGLRYQSKTIYASIEGGYYERKI